MSSRCERRPLPKFQIFVCTLGCAPIISSSSCTCACSLLTTYTQKVLRDRMKLHRVSLFAFLLCTIVYYYCTDSGIWDPEYITILFRPYYADGVVSDYRFQ